MLDARTQSGRISEVVKEHLEPREGAEMLRQVYHLLRALPGPEAVDALILATGRLEDTPANVEKRIAVAA